MTRLSFPVLTVLLASMLSACTNRAQSTTADLTGLTQWQLIELDGKTAIAESMLTLSIDLDRMTMAGSAGCNRFSTRFEVSGPQLELGGIGLTKRMCAHPDGVMAQEAAFVQVLKAVDQLNYDGESLRVSGRNGTLVFVPLRQR